MVLIISLHSWIKPLCFTDVVEMPTHSTWLNSLIVRRHGLTVYSSEVSPLFEFPLNFNGEVLSADNVYDRVIKWRYQANCRRLQLDRGLTIEGHCHIARLHDSHGPL